MDWRIPDFSEAGTSKVRTQQKPRGLAALPAKQRAKIQAQGRAERQERIRRHDRRAGPMIQELRGRGYSLGEAASFLDGKMPSPGQDFGFRNGRGGYWWPMAVKRIEDRFGRPPAAGGA